MKLGTTMLSMAMLVVPAYGVSAAENTDGVVLFDDGGYTVYNDGNDTSVSNITEEKNSSASNEERIFEKSTKLLHLSLMSDVHHQLLMSQLVL